MGGGERVGYTLDFKRGVIWKVSCWKYVYSFLWFECLSIVIYVSVFWLVNIYGEGGVGILGFSVVYLGREVSVVFGMCNFF